MDQESLEDIKQVELRDKDGNLIDPSKIELDQDFIDSLFGNDKVIEENADTGVDSVKASSTPKPALARVRKIRRSRRGPGQRED